MRSNAWSLALVAVLLSSADAHAWILHEHWAIARNGVEHQDEARLKELQALWARLAQRYPERFCSDPVGTAEGLKRGKGCVDFAVLSALAGDHSCSPDELWRYVRDEPWVIDVLAVAGGVALEMQASKTPTERNDIWDVSHLRLEGADAAYSTRAGENTAHFSASRMTAKLDTYVGTVLGMSTPSNAVGIYIHYHLAALRYALDSHALAQTDPAKSDELLIRALVVEAYAEHFLQDTYSAGHIVSSWGNVAMRKGTHDHYSINGVDAHTWNGTAYSARGDAHLREEDLNRAGQANRDSLAQVLDAARGLETYAQVMGTLDPKVADAYAGFDTCKASVMPRQVPTEAQLLLLRPILEQTVMPGRMQGDGAYPRFRAEIGPFVRLYAGLAGGAAFAGYQTEEFDSAGSPRGRVNLTMGGAVGIGLEGVTGRSGDGTVFLQGALTLDAGQYDGPCFGCSDAVYDEWHRDSNSAALRVPARAGMELRLRAPYWLLPGDLIAAGAVLIWAAPDTMKAMGLRAVRGGLIPWQRTLLTSIGTFQFMIGREIGVTLRGFAAEDRYAYRRDNPSGAGARLFPVAFRTVELDLPVLEYRPYREFQSRVTAAVLLQLGFSTEFVTRAEYDSVDLLGEPISPPGGSPSLNNSFFVYLRVAFDGRVYF